MENSFIAGIFALVSLVSIAGVIYPFPPYNKRWRALLTFFACFVAVGVFAPRLNTVTGGPEQAARPEPSGKFWVTSARLNRRTCPSTDCGVVGQFFFREGTDVFERRDGWARVTKHYDASCVNGRSEYVDSGNNRCTPENGISDGQFAEWVAAEFLSKDRPPDAAEGASGAEALIAGSDDFARYRTAFAEAAQSLIDQRRCTESDFREMGGWVKSSSHRDRPIYFTYCGGSTVANRLYLNAKTGEVFR